MSVYKAYKTSGTFVIEAEKVQDYSRNMLRDHIRE